MLRPGLLQTCPVSRLLPCIAIVSAKQSPGTFLHVMHIPVDRKLSRFEVSYAGTLSFNLRLVMCPDTRCLVSLHTGHHQISVKVRAKTGTQGQHPLCWPSCITGSLALPSDICIDKVWEYISCPGLSLLYRGQG